VPEFGVPGPWSVGVSEGGGGRLIKVGVFISRVVWEMARLWVLVFALIPLDMRCTPVVDLERWLEEESKCEGFYQGMRVYLCLCRPSPATARKDFFTIDGAVQDQSS
jgi:hypothetical protein